MASETMDPDLERLIETYRYACENRSFGHIMDAKTAIHRWHVAAVERAEADGEAAGMRKVWDICSGEVTQLWRKWRDELRPDEQAELLTMQDRAKEKCVAALAAAKGAKADACPDDCERVHHLMEPVPTSRGGVDGK